MPSPGTWDHLLTVTQAKLAGPAPERQKLPIASLSPNPDQPRRYFDAQALAELAASLKAHGVLQPLLVRPMPGDKTRYQIVAGERRYQAALQAGLTELPAIVRELDDAQTLELALVENVLREDITPLEEARSLQRLLDTFHYSYAQLGERLGKNKAYVDHRVRLLKMPMDIQEALERTPNDPDGGPKRPFTPRHAGVVSQIDDAALRAELMAAIAREGLSVAETMRRKNALLQIEAAPSAQADEPSEVANAHEPERAAARRGTGAREAQLASAAADKPPSPLDCQVEASELAVTALIDRARMGDGRVSARQLLWAIKADRERLEALLEGSSAGAAEGL